MSAVPAVDRDPVSPVEGRSRRPRTALAFALAPGIAALTGSATFVLLASAGRILGHLGDILVELLGVTVCVGLVGYISAGLFAAPLYALLSESMRRSVFAVVPSAGASAAAPWLLLSLPAGRFGLVLAAVAFGLGCVGGVAFLLIRGAAPAEVGEP